jgi:sugar/nucleoside kinase (ribokinase family)
MTEFPQVISIGGATQDVFVRSDGAQVMRLSDANREKAWLCFDYGAKVNVEQIRFNVGGGATNTAVSLARLGVSSACLAKIGRDSAGVQIEAELHSFGVDTQFLCRCDGNTGYSVVLTSYEGERSVLTYRGANSTFCAEDIPWEQLTQAQWLYISSLSGESDEILDDLAVFAETHGVSLAINPGQTQIRHGLLGLRPILSTAEVLLLNKEEAAELTGLPLVRCQKPGRPADTWDLDAHLKALKAIVPGWVVITDGKRGVQAYDGVQALFMGTYPTQVVDVLGAGDAFGSALVAGLILKGNMTYALKLAAANGAGVVTEAGAHFGLQTRASAEALMQRFVEIVPQPFVLE